MAVTKRTRFEVLKRDDYTCRYCRSAEGELTIDHVVPIALGGTDESDNLVAACRDCNSGKASTSPTEETVADVKEADIKWAAAMARAAEIRAADRRIAHQYLDTFLEEWPSFHSLPNDADVTLESFRLAGLPIEEVLDAVRVTHAARGVQSRFRYFAGVCWRKISNLQDVAKALLEAEATD